MIPYILALRAGDATLLAKNMMGDIEKQLGDVKDSLKQARRNKKYQHDSGDMILKGRYDLDIEHLMPDLTKLFNESIIRPVNYDLLAGLGLIELQGFSSSRQESMLNPKVLIEEITNGVNDVKHLYEEVIALIIEKNKELHPKHMGEEIRVVPGIIKAFLTDDMRKMIKSHVDTGILSIEDAFEGLPQGYDFEVSRNRRKQEADNGDDELFFPRVILNQDSNVEPDVPGSRVPTPQEVPQNKKKVVKPVKKVKASSEYVQAPYDNVSQLPNAVKNHLPTAAQHIFMRVVNEALKEGKSDADAFKLAWGVVKKSFKKVGDKWVKKEAEV
jgi:cation transport regulator